MRLRFLDTDLKAFQVDLTQRPLSHVTVGEVAVGLLIVAGIVLDGRRTALMHLHAVRDIRSNAAGKERILGIILKVTSAQWRTVDIHSRRQPQMGAEHLHLTPYQIA